MPRLLQRHAGQPTRHCHGTSSPPQAPEMFRRTAIQ
jgi:hypothetical protein